MSDVWAYHAGLDRYAQVPESAIPQMSMSGWVQQDPPPPPPELDEEAAAAGPEPEQPAASRRRPGKTTAPAEAPEE